MKGNIHKKMTYEDRFDRRFACWVKNNRKAWRFWKRKARKDFRTKVVKTIVETENGINAKTFHSLDDLWNDLNA